MKSARQIAIVILTLVAIPASAQGPKAPWPPEVVVSPQDPGVSDAVTLTFSDTWPRNCFPFQSEQTHAVQVVGNSIYVTIYTGERLACLDIPSPWQIERSVGPLPPGCYDVYVALEAWTWADEPFTKVTTFCVEEDSPSTPSSSCWPLYVLTRDGIRTVSSTGDHTVLINGHEKSYAIEILNDRLYATDDTRGADIVVYNLQGQYLETISTPSQAKDYLTFVALPEGRFALLDNVNDKIFFIDEAGNLLATTPIRPFADNSAQSVDGIVVGNRLIVSEDGYHHILQVDLTTYQASIFKDLSNVPGPSLLAIEYSEGTYYVSTGLSLYSFTESGDPVKVADVPEKNITGIVVAGQSAYVSVNFSGKIYRIDLTDGHVTLLASDLNYPLDMECARDTGKTGYFELCADSMALNNWFNYKNCKSFSEPWLTSLPPKPTWAPVDAVVTKIEYRVLLTLNVSCSDMEISLDSDSVDTTSPVILYDNLGGLTDGGYDDDPEDDGDIDLDWRYTTAFNGQSVHQDWTFCFVNTVSHPQYFALDSSMEELCVRIYWEIPDDQPCCGVEPGDRVVLQTDYPRGAAGLVAGMEGTVICCDGDDPDLPIFVSWDNWANGRNSDGYCDTAPVAYAPYSGWWMGCQDITLTGTGGGGGPGGGQVPASNLVFCFGGECAPLVDDPASPASSNAYVGSMTLVIEINFTGRFSATVTPTSLADGTWTAWLEPEVLGPGTVTATLRVRGENLNLSALPVSSGEIQVAEVQVFVVPVF